MKLYTVNAALIPDLWPGVEPLLKRALKFHPFMTTDGLLRLLLSGMAALIVAVEDERILCAAVMERTDYPETSVGNVIVLAGERGTYRHHMDEITDYLESWCRAHGCGTISMLGRPGWSKFVGRRGWSIHPYVSAWKALQ